MAQKPTVGRTVDFFPGASDEQTRANMGDKQKALPAVIVKTGLDGSDKPVINVNVHTNNGNMPLVHKHGIKHADDVDTESGEPYWNWPVIETEAKSKKKNEDAEA